MTQNSSNPVTAYLTRLDSALVGVEPSVRAEIVSGIREELAGLDPADAAARIADLGDPALIAAEARAGTTAPVAEPAPGRTLSIVAVLVLIVGSFAVPVLGALVGLIWVSLSAAWSRREKLVMWLVPVVSVVVVLAVVAIVEATDPDAASPTLPVGFAGVSHLALLVPFVVPPIEGLVLLVRAQRRGWRPETLSANRGGVGGPA